MYEFMDDQSVIEHLRAQGNKSLESFNIATKCYLSLQDVLTFSLGNYFIDRDPRFFDGVLDFLRSDGSNAKDQNKNVTEELKFYYLVPQKMESKQKVKKIPTKEDLSDRDIKIVSNMLMLFPTGTNSEKEKKSDREITFEKSVEQYNTSYRHLMNAVESAENEIRHLDKKIKKFETDLAEASAIAKDWNYPIHLNVCGEIFSVSKATLSKYKDTLLNSIAAGNWDLDDEGRYFIDRSAKYFAFLMCYLRDNETILWKDLDEKQLKSELEFYRIPFHNTTSPFKAKSLRKTK